MASFTIGPDPRFHVGATVYCWRQGGGHAPASPTPTTTGAVALDSTTTFTGLADNTPYLAGLAITGPFVDFRTPVEEETDGGGGGEITGSVVLSVEYDDGWGPRPHAEPRLVIWNGGDVSTPPSAGGETGAMDGVDEWHPASGEEA